MAQRHIMAQLFSPNFCRVQPGSAESACDPNQFLTNGFN
jgi:hypothetical protein